MPSWAAIVALGRRCAADAVVGGETVTPAIPFPFNEPVDRGPRCALDDAPAAARQAHAIQAKASDRQGAHGGEACLDVDPDAARAGLGALDRNQRRAGEAGLGGPVDDCGVGDRRQGRQESDRLHAGAKNRESDRVFSGIRVGVEDRLAQRSRPGVAGVEHRERRRGGSCRGEERGREEHRPELHSSAELSIQQGIDVRKVNPTRS
jgi:hypothetical protein